MLPHPGMTTTAIAADRQQPSPLRIHLMFDPEKPPELQVTRWLDTTEPITLAGMKGKVVALIAFQMLCPGCVGHALPQMRRLAQQFSSDEVAVIGLHTVFEHHDAMGPESLAAFVHEYRWGFPIGIDVPDGDSIPKTMAAYELRGTPTLLLFDRQGRLRRHYFGQIEDLRLGAEVMALATEPADAAREFSVRLERTLAATLVDPDRSHHHHEHEHGENCGCEHDHDHPHDHGHTHGHEHTHDHGQPHEHSHKPARSRSAPSS
jgi:peroxiredoxin